MLPVQGTSLSGNERRDKKDQRMHGCRLSDRSMRSRSGRPPAPATARRIGMSARRIGAITVVGVLGAWTAAAHAADWPTRPVRVIVPYGAGGVAGLSARLTIEPLTKKFGQPFVLENRPG